MTDTPATGFTADGQRYVVRDIHALERADSHLFNDRIELQIDKRGTCRSRFMQPNACQYSEPLRSFFLRDEATGEFWSVPFDPVQREPDSFAFSAGTADIRWCVSVADIEATVRVTIPRGDTVELWTVTVTNRGETARELSLYTYFPIGIVGHITQIARYEADQRGIVIDYFPYYVTVPDYFKLKDRKNTLFCIADRQPVAGEANHREFLGGHGPHDPAALHQPQLGGNEACAEPAVMALQFRLDLAADASETTNVAFGPAADREDVARLIDTYLKPDGVEAALADVRDYLETIRPAVRIETPDRDFDHFVNVWLPQQTHFCGGLLRLDGDPCVRNAYQDAMGAVYNLPHKTREWFLRVTAHQHADGFMPHGAPLADGVDRALINTIPHRDMNVWPPLAVSFYVKETGDRAVLNEQIGFLDSEQTAPLYEHLCLGLEWQLRDRTERGLCRIGEGDWSDPLNMAGWQEKGESIWLTEALALALDTTAELGDLLDDADRCERYRQEAEAARQAINDLAWDGGWYARGTTDAGRWFGTAADEEGRIFLNAQSWAMMCGAAETPERVDACMRAVDEHLMTPSGPMTLAPPFTHMWEDIGKLTQKTPGTNENGSVYCHAATFYAYALFQVRRSEDAFRVLRMLLTGAGSNPLSRSQQLPLYVPNSYRGLACGKTAGRASGHWGTGTCAWYYRTAIAELLGVRAEFDGLRIDPQLPAAWDHATVHRDFRGAHYTITIRRSDVNAPQISLDGTVLDDNLVPLQLTDHTHTIEVLLPPAQA